MDLSEQPIFTETLPDGGGEFQRSVDLSDYSGQSLYIHFRHHNSSNQGLLYLDNIKLHSGSTSEIHGGGKRANLSVYPNPSNGVLNFSLNSTETTFDISVISLTGKVVKRAKLNSGRNHLKLNCSELNAGTYILNCSNTEGNLTRERIIIY